MAINFRDNLGIYHLRSGITRIIFRLLTRFQFIISQSFALTNAKVQEIHSSNLHSSCLRTWTVMLMQRCIDELPRHDASSQELANRLALRIPAPKISISFSRISLALTEERHFVLTMLRSHLQNTFTYSLWLRIARSFSSRLITRLVGGAQLHYIALQYIICIAMIQFVYKP